MFGGDDDNIYKWLGVHDMDYDGDVDLEDDLLEQEEFELIQKELDGTGRENDDDDDWRLFCEDGSDYDLNPDDFDTEEEYEEALQAAKEESELDDWREYCEDGSEFDLNPEDFETEEDYEEALEFAKRDKEICEYLYGSQAAGEKAKERPSVINDKYIVEAVAELGYVKSGIYTSDDARAVTEKADFVLHHRDNIAAKYLSITNGFDLVQAIIDNIPLRQELHDDYNITNDTFEELLHDVSEFDWLLAMHVWDWTIQQFLPHSKYDENLKDTILDYPVEGMWNKNEGGFITFLLEHQSFLQALFAECDDVSYWENDIVDEAIRLKQYEVAKSIVTSVMNNPRVVMKDKIEFVDELIDNCACSNDVAPMLFVSQQLMPIIEKIDNASLARKLPLFQAKVNDFITEHAETELRQKQMAEERDRRRAEQERLKAEKEQLWKQKHEEILKDDKIYIYCGVLLPGAERPYSYRTEDFTIKVGDWVKVPVGEDNRVVVGEVVSVGQYKHIAVPYSVSRSKFIIEKDYFHTAN